jgi:hypothetical protein
MVEVERRMVEAGASSCVHQSSSPPCAFELLPSLPPVMEEEGAWTREAWARARAWGPVGRGRMSGV